MSRAKPTAKQARMQVVIDRLVAVCGELQDIQAQAMPWVTRFPTRAPHALYSSTFLDAAITATDESINAMIAQLGEKNLR